jgi:hypothetical protein
MPSIVYCELIRLSRQKGHLAHHEMLCQSFRVLVCWVAATEAFSLGRRFTEMDVQMWHAQPHTPEQNGKIERFLATLDKSRHESCDPNKTGMMVRLYKCKWKHHILNVTHQAGRQSLVHWTAVWTGFGGGIKRNLV